MPLFYRCRFLLAFFCGVATVLNAQAPSVVFFTPTQLTVCGDDEASFDLSASAALSGLECRLTLPQGLVYVSGSVDGAVHLNPGDNVAPRFALANVTAGETRSVSFRLQADCGLTPAINSGQQFAIGMQAWWPGDSAAYVSPQFNVETALPLLTGVTPQFSSGQYGDTLIRTLTLRNTRQGRIGRLYFQSMTSAPGLTLLMDTPGVKVTPVPNSPSYFAELGGDFFKNFGNGDAWFDFNEEAVLIEKVIVQTCGWPPTTPKTAYALQMVCGDTCQRSSLNAFTTILPFQQQPQILIRPKHGGTQSLCGEQPGEHQVMLVSQGAWAGNVVLLLDTQADEMGIDSAGISYDAGDGPKKLYAASVSDPLLWSCPQGGQRFKKVSVKLPDMEFGDTIRVAFRTYNCQEVCSRPKETVICEVLYDGLCPGQTKSEFMDMTPDTIATRLNAWWRYSIGKCLENDSLYNTNVLVRSGLLKTSANYLMVEMKLPWGLFLPDDCMAFGDATPAKIEVIEVAGQSTRYVFGFGLPLSTDTLRFDLCLKNICQDKELYEEGETSLVSGGTFLLSADLDDCQPCKQKAEMRVFLSQNLDSDNQCGVSSCSLYEFQSACQCTEPDSTDSNCVSYLGMRIRAERFNKGYADDDDDRIADNLSVAAHPDMRLDRYLYSDTMRAYISARLVETNPQVVGFQIFNEVWLEEMGAAGGDAFAIEDAVNQFCRSNNFRFIGGKFILRKSNGAEYVCDLSDYLPQEIERVTVSIAKPNVSPQQILDRIAMLNHTMAFSSGYFHSKGCLPLDVVFEDGDEMDMVLDWRMASNVLPLSLGGVPALINFHTSFSAPGRLFAWKSKNLYHYAFQQYSGFDQIIKLPAYGFSTCTDAVEKSPLRYRIHIARGNMFPYEVRPLARLGQLQYLFPMGISPLEARIRQIFLQENKLLLSDAPMDGVLNGDLFTYNFGQHFAAPGLDEGFVLEAGFRFGPECAFEAQPSSCSLTIDYIPQAFYDPDPFTATLTNPVGHGGGNPGTKFIAAAPQIEMQGDQLSFNFVMQNLSNTPSEYTWLTFTPADALDGLSIANAITGQPINVVNGLAQLGNIAENQTISLRFDARVKYCASFMLTAQYGWGCEPVLNLTTPPCGVIRDSIQILIRRPELELVIRSEPNPLTPCEDSEYFEIEVYNANFGYAFGVRASALLPDGVKVVSGSSAISYPAGAPFAPIPDPVPFGASALAWNLETASALIGANGLTSVAQAPNNSAIIRFRVRPDCGAVSNAQAAFTARGELPCGLASNVVRKAGEPLLIGDLTPSYQVNLAIAPIQPTAFYACGDHVIFGVSASIQGDAGPGDSLYILLPAGLTYLSGSYLPVGPAAPVGPPVASGANLALPIPVGSQGFVFQFAAALGAGGACSSLDLRVQTRESANALCNGVGCDFYVATGEAQYTLPAATPDWLLRDTRFTQSGASTEIALTLENGGPGPAPLAHAFFYIDANGNQLPDPGETFLGEGLAVQWTPSGASLILSANLSGLTPADLCRLIAVFPADVNCACADRVFSFANGARWDTELSACAQSPIALPFVPTPGHQYQWLNPQGLNCTNCPNPVFTPTQFLPPGAYATVAVLETTPHCTVERRFNIRYGEQPRVLTQDTALCRGQTLRLEALQGAAEYFWTGEGVSDPTQASQWVNPTVSGYYAAKITLNDGCEATDSVWVQVLAVDTISLEDRYVCPGAPALTPGGLLTDQPGVYTARFDKSNGCDSLIVQRLVLAVLETSETRAACVGDTLLVFDEKITSDGTYCRTTGNALGCDSTHCLTAVFFPRPALPAVSDSFLIARGQSLTLEGPAGLAAYLWSPPLWLSCTDCRAPVATPDSNVVYTLRVRNEQGCETETQWRGKVLPPCDPERLPVPNVFTPDGDGINDSFRVLSFEGFERVLSLRIYNRWGALVYEGKGADAAWNGRIQDAPAASDVYIWIIEADCDSETTVRKGDVLLLR